MGLFDWYEPVPPIACPCCGGALDEWQGKGAECALWVWRQGEVAPVAQRVDAELRSPRRAAARLPMRFEIYATCANGHHVDALGEAPEGSWAQTTLITPIAPIPWRQGVHGGWSCACCGCFTRSERQPGTYEICPVCWWEDDLVQFESPDYAGGANVPCLRDARLEYLRSGVADPNHRSRVRPPRPDELE